MDQIAAIDEARASGLLDGEKTAHVSFRAPLPKPECRC
jgi:hypothetical protein